MKSLRMLLYVFWVSCIFCTSYGCQSVTSQEETQKQPSQLPTHFVTVEEFKQMSPEEQWRVIPPTRRNHLRDIYFNKKVVLPKFLKQMVEKEPNMETSSPSTTAAKKTPPPQQRETVKRQQELKLKKQAEEGSLAVELMEMTPAQQWQTFSETRKKYMKAHPEYYPDFKLLIK